MNNLLIRGGNRVVSINQTHRGTRSRASDLSEGLWLSLLLLSFPCNWHETMVIPQVWRVQAVSESKQCTLTNKVAQEIMTETCEIAVYVCVCASVSGYLFVCFPISRHHLHSQACGSFFHLQSEHHSISYLSESDTDCAVSFTCKDSCDYIGSIQTIKDNLPISRSIGQQIFF